jgi:N-acetylmuramoyl-L-alanine amidase
VHHDSANARYLKPHKIGNRTFYQTTRFQGYSVFFSQRNPQWHRSLEFASAIGNALRGEGLQPTPHHAEKIPGEGRDLILPELGVYRYDDLIVLWSAKMPAVLLECGLIINPIEEALLNEPEHQQKIVRAVRTAVLKMAER